MFPSKLRSPQKGGSGEGLVGMEGHFYCSFLSSAVFVDENQGHCCGSFEKSVPVVLCRFNSSQIPLTILTLSHEHILDRVGPGLSLYPRWGQASLSLSSSQDQF